MTMRQTGAMVFVIFAWCGQVAAAAAPAGSGTSATPVVAAAPEPVRYRPPVAPLTVLRRFDPGVSRYGAGHRGVDLAAAPGAAVQAAADGVVSFAGPVAGRGVVVILHSDGVRTTYEPVRPLVRVGQSVSAGQRIATVTGSHPGCPQACVHWGARRALAYFDPLSLLRPLGQVRLLPWN